MVKTKDESIGDQDQSIDQSIWCDYLIEEMYKYWRERGKLLLAAAAAAAELVIVVKRCSNKHKALGITG